MDRDLRKAAVALLARRSRTGRGLLEKLVALGFPEADALAVVTEFGGKGWLADGEEALDEAFERKRRRLPPGLTPAERSKKLLAHLVRRGFAPAAVLEALRRKGETADDDLPDVDV